MSDSISGSGVRHAHAGELREDIWESVSRTLETRSRRRRQDQVSARVPTTDPLAWVAAQQDSDRFYWNGRGTDRAIGGVGAVAHVSGTTGVDYRVLREEMKRYLMAAPRGVRFFGGIRFDDDRIPDNGWEEFTSYRFVVPRFEMRTVDGKSLLVCNLCRDDDGAGLLDEIEGLRPILTSRGAHPRPLSRTDHPTRTDWQHAIEWALSAFSSTALAKVVLARMVRFEFEDDVDAYALLDAMRAVTPSCYHFLFSEGDSSFVGATPELLFRQEGSSIVSEAVAGTRPRGKTEGDDRQLRRELLLSEKDQREHEYVRQAIKEALADVTRLLHVDTVASEMKLAQGRHLLSRVDGTLLDGADAFDLLARLHPTPAVGGYPCEEAMDVISHLEPFDRGWYAGPVGWIGRDTAEFAVAIRSGLAHGRLLDVFSGAGIVCGSDPQLEWEEVEQKIGDFLNALQLDHRI